MTDLSTERLASALGTRRHEFYAEITSTNDRAQVLLNENAPNGTVIIADSQTRGRGRLGRVWLSPAGSSLMLSYLLRPPVTSIGHVGMIGALAVAETLDAMGIKEVGIKWPNDVQIGKRKVCGVLPEVVWQGDQLIGVILGIGINVRVDFTTSALAETAISLSNVIPQVDRLDLLLQLLHKLDIWSAAAGSTDVFAAWHSRLNMLNAPVNVVSITANTQEILSGVAQEVTPEGALMIRTPDGGVHRVIAGDIALG